MLQKNIIHENLNNFCVTWFKNRDAKSAENIYLMTSPLSARDKVNMKMEKPTC